MPCRSYGSSRTVRHAMVTPGSMRGAAEQHIPLVSGIVKDDGDLGVAAAVGDDLSRYVCIDRCVCVCVNEWAESAPAATSRTKHKQFESNGIQQQTSKPTCRKSSFMDTSGAHNPSSIEQSRMALRPDTRGRPLVLQEGPVKWEQANGTAFRQIGRY